MRKQFKDTVLDLSQKDDRTVVVLGDISHYLFNDYREKFPDRFFNMGICENTIISVSAALSSQGFFPFAHSINPFITERSIEQIKVDMCYNRFGGNVVSTGASFDYAWDGATHHSYGELAMLRLLPNMEVLQPGSKKEVDILMRSQYRNGKATYFRLSDHPHDIDLDVQFGKGVVIKDNSSNLTVMTAGPILANVKKACEDLEVNLVYFHTIKPIDKELILKFAKTRILVIHDAHGLYEAVCEVPGLSLSYHGIPDDFLVYYGTVDRIREQIGLDIESIRKVVKKARNKKT